ncbi:hypothetical protein M9H77_16815 [Catharanthus roseus]|uniref:Uncharacterized protein n=1 Tax=Catharanthus roseus TaxID=4058 RepID=A0ACC0B2U6_CATRO|nr:hypothetical protein M9H77_16815 [Catharanthus roseus]
MPPRQPPKIRGKAPQSSSATPAPIEQVDPCTPISSFGKGVEITVSRDTIGTALNIRRDHDPTFDIRRDHLSALNALVFPILIWGILFQHGVSFDGEEEEHTTDRQIINEAKLASIGFSCDHEGNWRRKEKDSIDDKEEEEEATATL